MAVATANAWVTWPDGKDWLLLKGLNSRVRVAESGRTRPKTYFADVPIRPGPMMLAVRASMAVFFATVSLPASPQISNAPMTPNHKEAPRYLGRASCRE